KLDDYTPYLYYTSDYGKTWKLLTVGIEKMHFTRCVRADRKVEGLLYAGTEYGLYISWNGGKNWMRYQNNLPVVSITDMTIKNNDLVVATQGRALWVLDNLNLIQQYNPDIAKQVWYVFSPENAWRMQGYNYPQQHTGENPPNGLVVHYWLKEPGDTAKIKIKVLDEKNQLIETYKTGDKKKEATANKGLNTFVWNMQYAESDKPEGLVMWNGGRISAKAAPGKYRVRLILGKDSTETEGWIVADPNYSCSAADYQQQFNFLREIQSKYDEVNEAIIGIRKLSATMNDLKGRLDKKSHAVLITLMDTVDRHFNRINDALFQGKAKAVQDILNYPIRINDRMVGIFDAANSGYMPPQQQVLDAFSEIKTEADGWLARYRKILTEDVKKMNELIHALNVDVIVAPKKE
ncbi:MAG: WD40/YVTN/BNR-like repeat-containing protein, partial [Flavobacteriales bacterium]